ncbi:MAG: hypothetical protein IT449_04105 [Phycisphaerales bacterium]|nr:hypothetical protein [Phycisphaerales bacterium]
MTRNLLCGAALVCVAVALTGCSGLGQTYAEREHRWKTVFDQDMQALADDIDMVCQTERVTRLTSVQQR